MSPNSGEITKTTNCKTHIVRKKAIDPRLVSDKSDNNATYRA